MAIIFRYKSQIKNNIKTMNKSSNKLKRGMQPQDYGDQLMQILCSPIKKSSLNKKRTKEKLNDDASEDTQTQSIDPKIYLDDGVKNKNKTNLDKNTIDETKKNPNQKKTTRKNVSPSKNKISKEIEQVNLFDALEILDDSIEEVPKNEKKEIKSPIKKNKSKDKTKDKNNQKIIEITTDKEFSNAEKNRSLSQITKKKEKGKTKKLVKGNKNESPIRSVTNKSKPRKKMEIEEINVEKLNKTETNPKLLTQKRKRSSKKNKKEDEKNESKKKNKKNHENIDDGTIEIDENENQEIQEINENEKEEKINRILENLIKSYGFDTVVNSLFKNGKSQEPKIDAEINELKDNGYPTDTILSILKFLYNKVQSFKRIPEKNLSNERNSGCKKPKIKENCITKDKEKEKEKNEETFEIVTDEKEENEEEKEGNEVERKENVDKKENGEKKKENEEDDIQIIDDTLEIEFLEESAKEEQKKKKELKKNSRKKK